MNQEELGPALWQGPNRGAAARVAWGMRHRSCSDGVMHGECELPSPQALQDPKVSWGLTYSLVLWPQL